MYEKNLISNTKHIHDGCKSLPVTYILLNRTTLSVKNAKDCHVIFTVLDSSFQTSSISEVIFSGCILLDKWVETFTQKIMQCKHLQKLHF